MFAGDAQTTTSLLLDGLRDGDRAAIDVLVTILFDELRGVAHRQRERWRGDHTSDTTALVNEVYLKLSGQSDLGPEPGALPCARVAV